MCNMIGNPAQLQVLTDFFQCTDVVNYFATHWMVIPRILRQS